jgi:hypothetical protein
LRVVVVEGIIKGYGRVLKSIGLLLFLLVVTGLASAIIVLPLWLWATRAKETYTLAVIILIGASVVLSIALKVRKEIRERGVLFREKILGALRRLSVTLLFLLLLYGILWLFKLQLYAFAVPALFIYLLLLGFVKYGKKRSYPPG